MNLKVRLLSTALALSSLAATGKTAAINHPKITIQPYPCPAPCPIFIKKPLSPEKKLEFLKKKLDLEYERLKLDNEKQALNEESRKIKEELKSIFEEMERGQDWPNLHETWQKKLDNCLEKRRLYREKLKSYQSKDYNWTLCKRKLVSEISKYEFDEDLSSYYGLTALML